MSPTDARMAFERHATSKIARADDLYALHIIPFVGSLKSGDKSAYRYLPESIAAVPQGEDMLRIMREAGFTQCRVKRLTLGVCSIYIGIKP